MTISKNAVALVALVASLFGIELGEDTIVELITALTTAISIGVMIYNQIDRVDTKGFFWKKK